ncbi:alpha-hydroxy acid oxidase [Paracoccus seriniphilus]|uniref:4-hydroxymandelate oxidase n=1 Tax=Paracoccus seriniphilus TaxID=184748 RepID=A0A239PQQ7_9RHOB|nr:alpha-hydroxy acid oxidase [Paracoccus seriniphilus]WCR12935.1 alpha-hydroxy-acid oxidizing protein [Paracoccus seriniphilus]SNT72634.1 4-hydroxymandelate oxidase [Paracoccus seriniphilus]
MNAIPAGIVSLQDYIDAAERRLSPEIWAYIAGSAADGRSRAANRAAFDRHRLRPRVLRDLKGGHSRLTLLGEEIAHPILVAPMAYHRLAHPDGEHATLLGAAARKAISVVSSQASTDMTELAARAQGPLWFQLYFQYHRDDTLQLVRRAEDAGYKALVVTVDAPVNGIRNQEQRAGFSLPQGIHAVNLAGFATPRLHLPEGGSQVFDGLMQCAPTWADIAWLRNQTELPILLKGILDPEDAELALEHGASGVILSNHGGRVLDAGLSALDALPQVRARLGARALVLMDGGIRRGTDVLIACALGADAVLVGLPILSALAVAGAVGVAHALDILRTEFEVAMALTGCKTLRDITSDTLWHSPPRQS